MFTNEDWNGIQEIARSRKREDPLKVGRFGIGFNSVYHITGESYTSIIVIRFILAFIFLLLNWFLVTTCSNWGLTMGMSYDQIMALNTVIRSMYND